MLYESNTGKTRQVVAQLQAEIASGEHGVVGDPFMTIRSLAEAFGISLVTAHRVTTELKRLGVLKRVGKRHLLAHRDDLTGDWHCKIGVLVTNLDNPFFSSLLNVLEQAGRRHRVGILAAGSDYDLNHEKSQLAMLKASSVDGFLICPAHDEQSRANLEGLDKPYVLVGRQIKGLECSVVMVENFTAGRKVAQHFLETGCEDFFYLGLDYFAHDERLRGFSFELKEHGFDLTKSRIHRLRHRNGQLNPDLLKTIHRGLRTGVFCYHDLVALRLIRGARLCDYRIPQDIAIVGFDNLPVASEVFPSLSSVAYPLTQIVENALRILLDRISRPYNREPEVCSLNAHLIVRESSSLSLHPPDSGHAAAKLS